MKWLILLMGIAVNASASVLVKMAMQPFDNILTPKPARSRP